MNPILQAAVGSVLRWALSLAAGFLVERGVWSQAEASTYVAAAVLGALSLGWSLWSKYHGRIRLLTTLSEAGLSEDAIKAHIAAGGATPSVSTPSTDVPIPRV